MRKRTSKRRILTSEIHLFLLQSTSLLFENVIKQKFSPRKFGRHPQYNTTQNKNEETKYKTALKFFLNNTKFILTLNCVET
jgi:hypothetical protein